MGRHVSKDGGILSKRHPNVNRVVGYVGPNAAGTCDGAGALSRSPINRPQVDDSVVAEVDGGHHHLIEAGD
jgi:hypothetical protein